MKLAEDNGSGVPGTVLGTWSTSNQPTGPVSCCATTIPVSPTLPLGAGKTYWVIAVAGASNTLDGWHWNSAGTSGQFDYYNGSSWTITSGVISAFDVIGCTRLRHV